MVEIDPAARIDLYAYVGITQFIDGLFPVPVDVAERDQFVEQVRKTADKDAVYAFRGRAERHGEAGGGKRDARKPLSRGAK